jgi:uncharacterized membrane protein
MGLAERLLSGARENFWPARQLPTERSFRLTHAAVARFSVGNQFRLICAFQGACAAQYDLAWLRSCNTDQWGVDMPEPNHAGFSDNAAGAIAYFTFIPAILFLLIPPYNTNRYVRFHAWQSLLLNVSAILISFLLSFVLVIFLVFQADLTLVFKRLVWVGWFVVWLICVVKAMNGQRFKLPVLGEVAERQASQ